MPKVYQVREGGERERPALHGAAVGLRAWLSSCISCWISPARHLCQQDIGCAWKLDFLRHHFLLTAIGESGVLHYQVPPFLFPSCFLCAGFLRSSMKPPASAMSRDARQSSATSLCGGWEGHLYLAFQNIK